MSLILTQSATAAAGCYLAASVGVSDRGRLWQYVAWILHVSVCVGIVCADMHLPAWLWSLVCLSAVAFFLFRQTFLHRVQRLVAALLLVMSIYLMGMTPHTLTPEQHAFVGRLAAGLLVFGVLVGVCWLWQVRHLRRVHWPVGMPSLEHLERYFIQWLWLGWTWLTQTMVSGLMLGGRGMLIGSQVMVHLEKSWLGVGAWCGLTLVLFLRSIFGWQGPRAVWVAGCLTVIVCGLGVIAGWKH